MKPFTVGTEAFADILDAMTCMRRTGLPVMRGSVMLAYMGKPRHRDMSVRRAFVLGRNRRDRKVAA